MMRGRLVLFVGLMSGAWAAHAAPDKRVSAPPKDTPYAVVLCYHSFEKKPSEYAITPTLFESHLKYFREAGWRVVPLETLVDALYGKGAFPDRSVVITDDDGYATVYKSGAPLLEKYRYPFSLFIYDQFVGKPLAMSWAQLRELAMRGAQILSHSRTHPRLTSRPGDGSDGAYQEFLDLELKGSRALLEKEFKKPVLIFAYPFGLLNLDGIQSLFRAGYVAAVTCSAEPATPMTDPWRIPRYVITQGIGVDQMRQILETRPLRLAHRFPEEGLKAPARLKEISAVLMDADRYDPATVEVRIDTVGSRKIRPAADGTIRYALAAPLKRQFYYVLVRAWDKQKPPRRHQSAWLIQTR